MNKTIYWANLTKLQSSQLELKPLLADLAQSQANHKGGNFVACPAISSKHKNTFVSTIPYDLSVKFYDNKLFTSDTKVTKREGLYDNSYAFDWGLSRIFFSKEPQLMETSPAFLHKTSYYKYGHAPSGAFDISQWFRPSNPTFQLWSGETDFIAKAGEAHLYFNFPSEHKINFEQFAMSDRLNEIMFTCVNYKVGKPKQQLPSVYNMFVESGLREETLLEIKNNLITPKLKS